MYKIPTAAPMIPFTELTDVENLNSPIKTMLSSIRLAQLNSTTVVIKTPDNENNAKEQFAKIEQLFLQKLSGHPHIIQLKATTTIENELSLVLEYMPQGDLETYLRKNAGPDARKNPIREKIFQDIRKGLVFIHQNNVVHRDIKCSNIFLDLGMRAVIGDFGFARSIDTKTGMYTSKRRLGTLAYMAPESCGLSVFDEYTYAWYSDIYSLGHVKRDLAMNEFTYPYSHIPKSDTQKEEVIAHIRAGGTPPLPEYIASDARDTILRCYKIYCCDRPTAQELLDESLLKTASAATPRGPI